MTALGKRWHLSEIPTVREAQREEGPGRCLGCGELLRYAGVGRYPLVCRTVECVRLYHQLYGWHRRQRASLGTAPRREPGGGNTPPATVTRSRRKG